MLCFFSSSSFFFSRKWFQPNTNNRQLCANYSDVANVMAYQASRFCKGFSGDDLWMTRDSTPLLSAWTSGECCWPHCVAENRGEAVDIHCIWWKAICVSAGVYTYWQKCGVQDCMGANLHDVITLNMWPPNSPDLNRFHYCIWYIPTIWLIPLKLPLPE